MSEGTKDKQDLIDLETVRRASENETVRRPEMAVPLPNRAEKHRVRPPEFFVGPSGSRLEVCAPMVPGGEGELYLCKDGSNKVVVKVLNYDSDLEILSGLQSLDLSPMHLMPLLHMGDMRDIPGREYDARQYTVSPYYDRGDLSSLENARCINPSIVFSGDIFTGSNEDYARVRCDYGAVDMDAFVKLVGQMHLALESFHSSQLLPEIGGIIHRDIRPQNILVNQRGDYFLGDFGLVSALERGVEVKFTQRFGVSHGYSPPEAYSDRIFKQSVTRKYDYFSLGMTLAHILGGRPLYLIGRDLEHLESYEVSLMDFYEIIALSNVVLPSALPERIVNLLRGLLTVSIEDRFGAEEVDAWLQGGNPVVHELNEELQSGIAIKVNRKVYRGEREVALAIVENWDLFLELLASGQLAFEWHSPDVAYKQRVRSALASAGKWDPERALIEVVRTIWPQVGHTFHGRRYETDRDLGRAMLACRESETEAFASYLCAGGLSSLKDPQQDLLGMRTLVDLERLAAVRPAAAVRVAGAYLAKEPLSPMPALLGEDAQSFSDLASLAQFAKENLETVIADYLQRTAYELPRIGPVPGIYTNADKSQMAVVQCDGTVIGDTNALQESMDPNVTLQRLLQWAVPHGRLTSALDLNEDLYAHLLLAGNIQFQNTASSSEDAHAGSWDILLRFLSLFPEFRLEHGLDQLFMKYFERIEKLLNTASSVRLPRVEKTSGAQVDLHSIDIVKRNIHASIQQFTRTCSYEDLYMALLTSIEGMKSIASLAHANKSAAIHVISVFRHVFAGTNTGLQNRYDVLMREYQGTLSSTARLFEFMEKLQELDASAQAAREEDFSQYMLSEEVEKMRILRERSGNQLDYVLPDTANARESFSHLCAWLQNKKNLEE